MKPEDQDFVHFQQKGDREALARVFDRVAPGLLLVAGHFTRDPAKAEDLVQTTFLHAIRDAARYDATRSVAAWLTSILGNRARDALRRDTRRKTLPLEDPSSSRWDPARVAADREWSEGVFAAIDSLGDHYRQVLALRLIHGFEPIVIAERLGRSTSTVRMQLKRGLEQLRQRLPASACMVALDVARRGRLTAARDAILAAPSPWGGVLGLTALPLGGILVKALPVTAAVLILALAVFALWPESPAQDTTLASGATPAIDEESGDRQSTKAQDEELNRQSVQENPEGPTDVAPEPFVVRVVFASDGRVATDIGVYVRQQGAAQVGFGARTDERGEAQFSQVPFAQVEVHMDRGRESILVDAQEQRTVTVEIPPGLHVEGQVVDLSGNPVAEATVYRSNADHHAFMQPVARTDSEGRFALSDVDPTSSFLARRSGYQPSELRDLRRDRSGEGKVRLELCLGAIGHALEGRVVDATQKPVPHARVLVAVEEDARESSEGSTADPLDGSHRKPMDREGFFVNADEHGEFVCHEVPAGHTVVVARPLSDQDDRVGWSSLWIRSGQSHEVRVVLGEGAQIVGTLRGTRGPVVDKVIDAEWEGTWELGQMEDDLGPWMSDRRVRTDELGRFRLGGLLPGDYDLRVIGDRDEILHDEMEIDAGARVVWNPTIVKDSSLSVRLMAADETPLEGWVIATTTRPGSPIDWEFFKETTDGDGRRHLSDLEAVPHHVFLYAPRKGDFSRLPVAVRSDIIPAGEEIEIRLSPEEMPSAGLTGICVDAQGKSLSGTSLTVVATERGGEAMAPIDDEGRFRIEGLSSGAYTLFVRTKGLIFFPLRRVDDRYPLWSGEVHSEQTLDCGVLTVPEQGTLVVDGVDEQEARKIQILKANGERIRVSWEAEGTSLRSSPLWPGDYELQVRETSEVRRFEVVGGEETRLDLNL